MKKIILAIAAVALIASPALAAEWNFYGSARIATFYNSYDFGDLGDAGASGEDQQLGREVPVRQDDDQELFWDIQNNSRIGARVKASDTLSGRFELGVSDNINTRLLFGEWKPGNNLSILWGKDYTPIAQFVSGQIGWGDNSIDAYDYGLLTFGTMYGTRRAQVKLSYGGLQVALIEYSDGVNLADPDAPSLSSFSDGDVDHWYPKVEAAYTRSFDTFGFGIRGGYQYYEVEDADTDGDGDAEGDLDITSWIIGGELTGNFGPLGAFATVSYSQNGGAAGWFLGTPTVEAGSSSVKDNDTLMASLGASFSFTDAVRLEAGVGYREDSPDQNGLEDDELYAYYLNAMFVLAPGVTVIPEVGYLDYKDNILDEDEGNQFYLGAKWQVDF
jgi:hypothetical protein